MGTLRNWVGLNIVRGESLSELLESDDGID